MVPNHPFESEAPRRCAPPLTVAGKKIPAERFDFSGDWQATVWFDRNRRLAQFKHVVDGHEVIVRLDE